MIIFCPSDSDAHADFAHRVVTKITVTDNIELIRYTYVICASCDHWIARAVPGCKCEVNCHRNPERWVADDDETG